MTNVATFLSLIQLLQIITVLSVSRRTCWLWSRVSPDSGYVFLDVYGFALGLNQTPAQHCVNTLCLCSDFSFQCSGCSKTRGSRLVPLMENASSKEQAVRKYIRAVL